MSWDDFVRAVGRRANAGRKPKRIWLMLLRIQKDAAQYNSRAGAYKKQNPEEYWQMIDWENKLFNGIVSQIKSLSSAQLDEVYAEEEKDPTYRRHDDYQMKVDTVSLGVFRDYLKILKGIG